MRVAVFVKASPSSEAGIMPSTELFADMQSYNERLVAAGIMKDGAGLQPTSKAVRVRFAGKDRTVINGPFSETKELVAGYWLWEVSSMEEAINWLKKCPNPMPEDSEIEIRPLFEASDFGDEFTPELREKELLLDQALAMSKSSVTPYIFYGGRCDEALEFYTRSLQAKVTFVLRFDESPEPSPKGMIPAGFESKIMHCEFQIGNTTIMASDGCEEKTVFEGFRLALTVPSVDDAARTFHALADGGKVDMPLMKTFWSPSYGMVTDRFGVGWMVMVPDQPA